MVSLALREIEIMEVLTFLDRFQSFRELPDYELSTLVDYMQGVHAVDINHWISDYLLS